MVQIPKDLLKEIGQKELRVKFSYLLRRLMEQPKYRTLYVVSKFQWPRWIVRYLRHYAATDRHVILIFQIILSNLPDKPLPYAKKLAKIVVPNWHANEYADRMLEHKKPLPPKTMTKIKDLFK